MASYGGFVAVVEVRSSLEDGDRRRGIWTRDGVRLSFVVAVEEAAVVNRNDGLGNGRLLEKT